MIAAAQPNGFVAQLEELLSSEQKVMGSNPIKITDLFLSPVMD
jgi:hypothetical protein